MRALKQDEMRPRLEIASSRGRTHLKKRRGTTESYIIAACGLCPAGVGRHRAAIAGVAHHTLCHLRGRLLYRQSPYPRRYVQNRIFPRAHRKLPKSQRALFKNLGAKLDFPVGNADALVLCDANTLDHLAVALRRYCGDPPSLAYRPLEACAPGNPSRKRSLISKKHPR